MIVMQLKGGLGNQLFQYSVGRCLAQKKQTGLLLDTSFYLDERHEDYLLPHSKFMLDGLDLPYAVCTEKERQQLIESARKFFSRVKRKINPYYTEVYIEKTPGFDPKIFTLPKNVFLTGWFQSEKYFMPIREQLMNEIKFKKAQNKANEILAVKMSSVNSISVHIRRGDYFKNEVSKNYFGILDLYYYRRCMEFIEERVVDPHFFIFSDDVNWACENFAGSQKITIVDINIDEHPVEDMHLMSLCKHNITANSSFSWWAAYLNTNPGKMVLAPELWFGTAPENVKDIVPDNWIKIKNQ